MRRSSHSRERSACAPSPATRAEPSGIEQAAARCERNQKQEGSKLRAPPVSSNRSCYWS